MLLVAIFAAVALFMASALIIVALESRSAVNARLLGAESRFVTPSGSCGSRVRDIFSTVTRPLSPVGSVMAGQGEGLSYRLGLAGYRKPSDVELFLTFK